MKVITEQANRQPTNRRRGFGTLRGALALVWASPTATIGLLILVFWVLVAIAAPLISPYDPVAIDSSRMNQGSSVQHVLGTDPFGRDVLSRLIYGSRTVLILAPLSVLFSMAIGITLGLLAAYYRGFIDELIMRVVDIMMSFPTILLYLIIIAAVGPSAVNIVIAVTVAGAPGIARLTRSLALDICSRDYIAAAKLRGENPLYIMFVEVLPNARGPLLIDGMLRIGYTVFAIGTLGFLGLGLRPPTPDWGSMINEARKAALQNPGALVWPSVAIATLVVGLNFLADGVSEELNRYQK
jgi:peptide/nickel transport system permease protein